MEGILNWGIRVIQWLQQFSPTLDAPFKALTFLGNEEFILLFLPFVYWCLDRRTGARLTALYLLSAYFNTAAKALVDQPRPFEYAPGQVLQLDDPGGGGLPSGHTQNIVVAWGYLASQFRRAWLWVLAAALMVLVPLSRLYLGVHFPQDLLGGYLLGALLLALFLWLDPLFEPWLERKGLAWQLALAIGVPLLLVLLLPTEDTSVTATAALLGMGVGFVLERRWVGFDSGGAWWKRALRFLAGGVVFVSLYAGLKVAFAALDPSEAMALVLRFVRYAILGLFGGLGAPWAFVMLGLAEGRERR